MRKIALGVGSLACGMILLVAVSSRHLAELFGYVKATADQTVEGLEDNVPNGIRDQKLQNDIEQARGDIIDRRVKLNLAASEIRRLQSEVDDLSAAVERRETILAEAYPALEAAAADRMTLVKFAGTDWQPTELGAEIDRLLMEQDRDERQLGIRREALERLVKSVDEGSAAITQMESKLVEAENEFQTLVVRREQAENENELLDLVASAGTRGKTAAAQIGSNLKDLRGDVEQLEARNEARRDASPLSNGEGGRLSQAWNRLERLKQLHDKRQGERQDVTQAAPESGDANSTQDAPRAGSLDNPAIAPGDEERKSGKNDVIIVVKDAQVQPSDSEDQE